MRLIDADKITDWMIDELRKHDGTFDSRNGREAANLIGKTIDEAPTEVKNGHWMGSSESRWQYCSACGVAVKKSAVKWVAASEDDNLNYCPHCGADMKER